jgi:hypothetical protein
MRARIPRVDTSQAANKNHGVQLPVRHPQIPPEWRSAWPPTTSQYIQNTKAAMKIAYRIETGITVKDTIRLPVSMDIMMIQGHHAATQRGEYTAIDLAVYTAQVLTLSRVSEYLHTGEASAHTLMSEDIQFEMLDGSMVPSHELGKKTSRMSAVAL